jgi:hypothetical protein
MNLEAQTTVHPDKLNKKFMTYFNEFLKLKASCNFPHGRIKFISESANQVGFLFYMEDSCICSVFAQ